MEEIMDMEYDVFTEKEMRAKAVKKLIDLNCFPAYKEKFRRSKTVTVYDGIGGYYIDENTRPELAAKIAEVENLYGGIVYAVIHNYTDFGELYSMLWQTKYKEDIDDVTKADGANYVYAYVWNRTNDDWSEFGTIGVVEKFGGLLRIA